MVINYRTYDLLLDFVSHMFAYGLMWCLTSFIAWMFPQHFAPEAAMLGAVAATVLGMAWRLYKFFSRSPDMSIWEGIEMEALK
jgi:hypothetical protein